MFSFRPKPIPTVITLLILPILLALGSWQLNRAQQKKDLQTAFEAQMALDYAPIEEVCLSDPACRYRKVLVEGRYDGQHQILLDNQIRDGRPGFHVFTPLRIPGREWAILVNRGWAPLGPSRRDLPDVAIGDAPVSLKGRVSQPSNPGLQLGESDAVQWPRVVQFLDYEQLSKDLGYPLAPAVILLDPDMAGGYLRDWRPEFGGMGPRTHYGYAVQWFALAAALVVIFIVVNTRRRRPSP
jgi:surfeit locus 1 family protein